MNDTVKRPWQVTFLGILGILGTLISIGFCIMFLRLFSLEGLFTLLLIPTIIFLVQLAITIFITLGAFNGEKSAMTLTLFFSVLIILLLFANFFSLKEFLFEDIVAIFLSIIMGIFANICRKHPFYSNR